MKNKLHNSKEQNRDNRLRKQAQLDHARRIADENEERFDRMYTGNFSPERDFDNNPAISD